MNKKVATVHCLNNESEVICGKIGKHSASVFYKENPFTELINKPIDGYEPCKNCLKKIKSGLAIDSTHHHQQ